MFQIFPEKVSIPSKHGFMFQFKALSMKKGVLTEQYTLNVSGSNDRKSTVMLTSGEVGVVYMSHPDPRDAARPLIKLLLDERGAPLARPELVDLRDKDARGAWSRVISRTVDPTALGIDVKRALYS